MNEKQSTDWMIQYQADQWDAFQRLYEQFSGRVFGYLKNKGLSNTDVEEVFQEVFLKFHRTRRQYKSQYPVSAWLFTITRSVWMDFLRKKQRRDQERATEPSQLESEMETQMQSSLEKDSQISISGGHSDISSGLSTDFDSSEIPLHTLNEQDQAILRQRFIDEATFKEIAQSLGLQEEQTRKRSQRALKRLRKKMLGATP